MDSPGGEGCQDDDPFDPDPEWPTGADTDRAADDEDGAVDHDPLRFHRWMRTSASGGILTGIALGLQYALEEKRQVPAFVMEAPGEPENPDALIRLHFDPDDPTKTVAVVRPPVEPIGDVADA